VLIDLKGGEMTASDAEQIEILRATERERLRALVEGDLPVADRLHADDFQLINPGGGVFTKAQYLGGIASGSLNYRVWEPDFEIEVRSYGEAAVIRYRSRLHMSRDGAAGELRNYWHTDSYEWRDGRWQGVWSQATLIQPAG
jgi:hypothetical protein